MDSYAGNLTPPPTFNMPGMPQAAGGAMKDIQGLTPFTNVGTGVLPQAGATAQNLYNNPFAPSWLAGAQYAAPMGEAAAAGQFNTGMGFFPAANTIMGTAFDPQQDLYARTLQQVQDQARAANAAAGVGTTPYGAGLEDQATRDFNINWQNQQLQRQIAGAQGAGGLAQTGAGLAGGAAPLFMQSAGIPYATYSGIGSGQFGALNNLLGVAGQGQGLAQTPIQDWLGYVGAGNQAGQVANQAFANQLAQSNLGWNQLGGLAKGVSSLLGWSPTPGGSSLGQMGWAGMFG